MRRLTRRLLLLGAGAGAVAAAGGVYTLTFTLHRPPRRDPWLEDAHLAALRAEFADDGPRAGGPRVLFVGNSFTLQHDIPGQVAALAAAEGREIAAAQATAHGNRLVQTLRVPGLLPLLEEIGWDVVVLQDFSQTALRAWDRWGAARAVARMAEAAAPARIVIFPPLVGGEGHRIYRGDAGVLVDAPADPEAYTARNEAFYGALAAAGGYTLAPLSARWLAAYRGGAALYAEDVHHASAEGGRLIAGVLWETIAPLLPPA